jgi:hypothetical protein
VRETDSVDKERLLKQLERAWQEFRESYAGMTERELLQSGVTGAWSVRDIIAHVTWWEEEALSHLPTILAGRRPARYSVTYGGINAFNAMMTERWKHLSLAEVLRRQGEVHRRLIDFITRVPADQVGGSEGRFRRRLRLDTFGHYPKHSRAIRVWRERRSGPGTGSSLGLLTAG